MTTFITLVCDDCGKTKTSEDFLAMTHIMAVEESQSLLNEADWVRGGKDNAYTFCSAACAERYESVVSL